MNPSPMTFRPRFQPQRLVLALTFGGALLAGLMSVAFAGEPAAAAPVTRAQVEQDLAAYQQSGLAALERDDSQSQVGTAAWREAADRMVRIPMTGSASSLNAANAASVVLYEVARQRLASRSA